MADLVNRQVLLAARPAGAPKDSDFALKETPVPEPGNGQVLCRTVYLSLDPYMRGRMSAAKSYTKPLDPGDVITGETLSQVVASNQADFRIEMSLAQKQIFQSVHSVQFHV